MPRRKLGMLEGFAWRVAHAQARHDAPGALVVRARDRNHFIDGVGRSGIAKNTLRGFGGEALTPMIVSELPRDLDARYDPRVEIMPSETDQADRLSVSGHEVATIAVAIELRELAIQPSLHLSRRAGTAEQRHDSRIGAE